ncbi:hypothetical protein BGW39_009864 [Mortierella sp. 14UC]|nr:hypothetical protein BGW39_009864 [Mortierella sp. 14UC]
MRILSFFLGLAAIAQAANPLVANGAQNNYEWASVSNQDLAAQVEDLSAQVSEIDFRSHILSRFQQEISVDFKAEGTCDGALSVIQTALPLNMVADSSSTEITGHAIVSITLAYESIINILQGAISVIPLEHIAKPVLEALRTLQGSVAIFGQCLVGSSKLSIEPSSCYALADIYRAVIQDAAGSNPVLNLPADAREDLRRLASGSRPIFAADILDQYRTELIRVTTDEEIKVYAVAALGTVLGGFKSLEACLRVAADPVAAIDELNEELEAQAIYQEEDEDEE